MVTEIASENLMSIYQIIANLIDLGGLLIVVGLAASLVLSGLRVLGR